MNIYIVIPAHNEESTIGLMLDSLVHQTVLPKKVVVVNDNSTDKTQEIAESFTQNHEWLALLNHRSSGEHIPGAKVINAFYKGYELLDNDFDIICKFDADIILPKNYLEQLIALFNKDAKIGIAGGLAYVQQGNNWIYETISSKNHVRGPFKAYRNQCFKEIGGLKRSIGWDTVDVLLAQYHGWKIATDKTLQVKHLKPTGNKYTNKSKYLYGEALYKMRFGIGLSTLSALKSAFNKKSIGFFIDTLSGYFTSKKNNINPIVTEEEGKFIRKLRWKSLFSKFGIS